MEKMLMGNPSIEKKEDEPAITTETITHDELIEIIYKGGSFPEKRFRSVENGGVFKYFDPTRDELSFLLSRKEVFYSVERYGDLIIGLAKLDKSHDEDKVYVIKFVSIDPEYQGMGYGTKLMEEVFRFAKEKGFALEASAYSLVGYNKLKPLQARLAKETGVDFRDTDRRIFSKDAKEEK